MIALLLPAIQAAREAARRSQCANNLKQLLLGVHNYHDTFGAIPPEYSGSRLNIADTVPARYKQDTDRNPSFLVRLLPFMEQMQLFNEFSFTVDMTNAANMNLVRESNGAKALPSLTCPSVGGTPMRPSGDTGCYKTHYAGVSGGVDGTDDNTTVADQDFLRIPAAERRLSTSSTNWGVIADNGAITFGGIKTFAGIPDGTSNTFCIGEWAYTNDGAGTNSVYRAWHRGGMINGDALLSFTSKTIRPSDLTGQEGFRLNFIIKNPTTTAGMHTNCRNDNPFTSVHPGMVHFGLLDGSIQAVLEGIDSAILLAYASGIDGKETPTLR